MILSVKKGTAPQTLLAVVTDNMSTTVPNNNIADNSKNVKKSLTDSDYLKAVRDANGNLLVVYHGTGADFNIFNIW